MWLDLEKIKWVDKRTGGQRRKNRMRWSNELKSILSEQQNHRCVYCGVKFGTQVWLSDYPTIEHVIPLSKGGQDHPDNLVIACHGCNMRKVGHEQKTTITKKT